MDVNNINTQEDAARYVQGCINDYEAGISSKAELISQLGEYTARIMHVFWNTTKGKIKSAHAAGSDGISFEQFLKDENLPDCSLNEN